jgi:hypothetical protein
MFMDSGATRRALSVFATGFALLALSGSGAFAAGATTTSAVKLLDGPLKNAVSIATVPSGSRVGVLWCGMRDKLCLVSFHNKAGFVGLGSLQNLEGHSAFGGAISGAHGDHAQGTQSVSSIHHPGEALPLTGFDNNGGDALPLAAQEPNDNNDGGAPPKSTTSTTSGNGNGGGVITRPIVTRP